MGKHLTKADRIKLEALLKAGHGKKEIADMLHVHRSTIYREIKRGVYTALNSDLTQEERYSPDIADDKYRENLKSKGGTLKIGNDIKLASGTNEVTNKMVRRKVPKGTNFDDMTDAEVEEMENWINKYPRRIHGYHSAGELFEEELKKIS